MLSTMYVENRYERRRHRRRRRILCGCVYRSFGKSAVYTGRFACDHGHLQSLIVYIVRAFLKL